MRPGFEQSLLSVYPWIQDWLARSSPTPLLLTGHSLGAAAFANPTVRPSPQPYNPAPS